MRKRKSLPTDNICRCIRMAIVLICLMGLFSITNVKAAANEGTKLEEKGKTIEPYQRNDRKDKKTSRNATEPKTTDSGTCGTNMKWTYVDGVLTISGSGAMAEFESTAPWHEYQYYIKAINLSEGITSISEAAFMNCDKFKSIKFPSTIKTVEAGAFVNCTSLASVELNEGLEALPRYMFQGCSFTRLHIPATVKEIDPLFVYACRDVEEYSVAAGNSSYITENGIIYNKSKNLLLAFPTGKKLTSFTIPSTVKTIGESAFSFTSVENVKIPSSVTEIKDGAFCYSNLLTLTIPGTVKKMGDYICEDSMKLESVVVEKGITSLGYRAFAKCTALKHVKLASSMSSVDALSFAYCTGLEEITIPSGITKILNGAFGECTNLKKVTMAESVKDIAYQAFFDCKSLTTISLPSKIENLYKLCFYGTGITTVTIPASTKMVCDNSFPTGTQLKFSANMKKESDGTYIKCYQAIVSSKLDYKKAFQVLSLVNAERKKAGLSGLTMDQELLSVAMHRASETAFVFSHTRPNSLECFSASTKMNAENIAYGRDTASGTMDQWMNSSGHKKNILSSTAKTIGIGCVKIDGSYHWVQCFGGEVSDKTVSASSYKNVTKDVAVDLSADQSKTKDYEMEIEFGEYYLKVGQTTNAHIELFNEKTHHYITIKNANFTGNNAKIGSVSLAGKITGKSPGKLKLTGYLKSNKNVKVSCSMQIKKNNQKVTKIKISGKSKKLVAGKKMKLKAKIYPSYAKKKSVTWKTSNKRYATVSKNGVVKAKKAGIGKKVTITATAKDGSKKKGTYKIKIIKKKKK